MAGWGEGGRREGGGEGHKNKKKDTGKGGREGGREGLPDGGVMHRPEVITIDPENNRGVGEVGAVGEAGGNGEGPAFQQLLDGAAFA